MMTHLARAHRVAHGAHQDAKEDGAGDGRAIGVSNLCLCQVKIIPDDGHQRRCHERAAEGDEEREPGQVEGGHVRKREGVNPDSGG